MKKKKKTTAPMKKETKYLKPVVRTMLLVDLVFLAAVQMLCDEGLLMTSAGDVATLLGGLVLIWALVLQFNGSDQDGEAASKKLRR